LNGGDSGFEVGLLDDEREQSPPRLDFIQP
jgi:hypothetical protein